MFSSPPSFTFTRRILDAGSTTEQQRSSPEGKRDAEVWWGERHTDSLREELEKAKIAFHDRHSGRGAGFSPSSSGTLM